MTINGPPLLHIQNLCVSYFTRAGTIPALVDFGLSLKPGESVALVGESGCGKSTVAMAIMGYLGRNGGIVGGSIGFRGRNLVSLDEGSRRQLRGAEIAMVYQEPLTALNPTQRIADQLMEVPMVHERVARAEAWARSVKLLDDVSLPDPERVMRAYPHQLSGGQQQRVVIAMALLSDPSLLLLDEPTTALDVTVEAGIVALIGEISRTRGTALLYISHNLGLIREVCDRVCVMYAGEIVEQGAVAEVFARPRHPYTQGLFACMPLPGAHKHDRPLVSIPGQLPLPRERPDGCNFGPRCEHFQPGLCDAGPIPLDTVRGADSSRDARCRRWREIRRTLQPSRPAVRKPAHPGPIVLRVQGLKKYYPVRDRSLRALFKGMGVRHVKANDSLDFVARAGETLAIVGESGCGKSTFARVLLGLETATGGTVHFDGASVGDTPVRKRSPAQLGALQMVFQNPDDTLNPSFSIGAQIGRCVEKLGPASSKAGIRERVQGLLARIKLPGDFAQRRPRQLSGGQKQRAGIARAFAGTPALVVADEPLSALDVSVAAAVSELLMEIQRDHGTTLLFISHDLSMVRYLADRVVVMYLGQIMERGTTREIFDPPYHPYTEALLSAIPVADPGFEKRRILLKGAPPSALDPPLGCPFHGRCPRKQGVICEEEKPPVQWNAAEHAIACHIPLAVLRGVEPVMRAIRTAG